MITNKHWSIRYACLGGSLLFVFFFMFYLAPAVSTFSAVQPILKFIEENDIDAGALYYSEIEEFSEAEINMKHTMDYPPQGK